MNRPSVIAVVISLNLIIPALAQQGVKPPSVVPNLDMPIKSSYVAVDSPGIILFNDSTEQRKICGYLLVDNNGRPAFYPSVKESGRLQSVNQLSSIFPADIETLWNKKATQSGVFSAELVGWNGKWNKFKVNLKCSKDRCISFKVSGPEISVKNWIPVDQIPTSLVSTKYPFPRPVDIECTDGPRDNPDCGIRPWDLRD